MRPPRRRCVPFALRALQRRTAFVGLFAWWLAFFFQPAAHLLDHRDDHHHHAGGGVLFLDHHEDGHQAADVSHGDGDLSHFGAALLTPPPALLPFRGACLVEPGPTAEPGAPVLHSRRSAWSARAPPA